VRTRDLLARYLPSPPAVVFHVGGGAGAYALSLAQDGHSVHLIEPVALLVDQPQEDAEREGIALARCDVGDARSLPGATGARTWCTCSARSTT
jgi:protein-L-isoaspartate O-methyltransferase